jgi:hypothetical protein
MVMDKSVEWLAGETEVLGENLPSAALSTTNPHAARTRTRATAVGSQRLTAELRHGLSEIFQTKILNDVSVGKVAGYWLNNRGSVLKYFSPFPWQTDSQ